MQQDLILLFGMPRSGTTWLGKIFDSHPDTVYRHEPDSWGRLNAIPLLAPSDDIGQYGAMINAFVAQLPAMRQTKVSGTLPIFRKNYYSRLHYQTHRAAVMLAKVGAKLFGEFPVLDPLHYNKNSGGYLVWKSIESVGRLGLIVRAVERCRAVLILRHPCGYIASVMQGQSQGKFTGGIPESEDMELIRLLLDTEVARSYGLSMDAMKAMQPLERLAWRWVIFNEKAMRETEGASKCRVVRYEDICSEPVEQAKALFEFSGLPWHGQTEAFVNRSTAIDSSSNGYYSVYQDPLRSASKWRTHLPSQQIEAVINVIRDTIPGRLYTETDLS